MKYLAICCAGNNSLHEKFIDNELFDSLIIYYGDSDEINERYKAGATYYAREKGIKFNLIWRVINENLAGLTKEQLLEYDYVWLTDDDILTNSHDVAKMFETMRTENLDLAQASLTKDSFTFWKNLWNQGNGFRQFNSVEIMMPFFSKRFFKEQYHFWEFLYTALFLDLKVWAKLVKEDGFKCAVVDKYQMKHTRKGGKGDVYVNAKKVTTDLPRNELDVAFRKLNIDRKPYDKYNGNKLSQIFNKNNIIIPEKMELNTELYYSTPKYYSKIYGFFDFEEIYQEAVHRAKDGAKFIELGVMQGKSACYLGECIKESGKKIKVELIDVWSHEQDTTQECTYTEYKDTQIPFYPIIETNAIVKPFNALKKAGVIEYFNFIQASSFKAHLLYDNNSFDFIFIDGDHQYNSVKQDLNNFYPKLKAGGMFAGHDYNKDLNPGVVRAVDEFVARRKLKLAVYEDKINKPYIIYK